MIDHFSLFSPYPAWPSSANICWHVTKNVLYHEIWNIMRNVQLTNIVQDRIIWNIHSNAHFNKHKFRIFIFRRLCLPLCSSNPISTHTIQTFDLQHKYLCYFAELTYLPPNTLSIYVVLIRIFVRCSNVKMLTRQKKRLHIYQHVIVTSNIELRKKWNTKYMNEQCIVHTLPNTLGVLQKISCSSVSRYADYADLHKRQMLVLRKFLFNYSTLQLTYC